MRLFSLLLAGLILTIMTAAGTQAQAQAGTQTQAASSLQDDLAVLTQMPPFQHRLFSGCHHCIPNEHEFYLFNNSLQKQGDVLLSIGTFRSFENASRGDYQEGFFLEIDEDAIRFNEGHIKALAAGPEAADFIPNFLREPDLYQNFPEWRELFEKGRYGALIHKMSEAADRPSKVKYRGLPLERYLIEILLYCITDNPLKQSFLCDPVRYRRLHTMALEGRLHALRVDVGGKSMATLNQILIKNNLKVRTFDISNVSMYIPFEHLDSYKDNLRNVPWSENSNIQMTIMGTAPTELEWNYYNWKSGDFVEGLKDLEIDGYFEDQMVDQLPKAQLLEESNFEPSVDCSKLLITK